MKEREREGEGGREERIEREMGDIFILLDLIIFNFFHVLSVAYHLAHLGWGEHTILLERNALTSGTTWWVWGCGGWVGV